MNLDFINSVILIEWLEKHDKTRLEIAKKTGRTYGNKFNSLYTESYFKVKKGYEIAKNNNTIFFDAFINASNTVF